VRKIAFPHQQHRNEGACVNFGLFTHSITSTKFKMIAHFLLSLSKHLHHHRHAKLTFKTQTTIKEAKQKLEQNNE
jgi:hypothetical protein